jgi:hypothetical protein
MKLLLRREQKTSLLGNTSFVLIVRAEFARDEQLNIHKYRLGPNVLYSRLELTDRGSGVLGLVTRLAIHAMNISVTVDDLVGGKRLEFKTIEEMAFVENQIKEACEHLRAAIGASAGFGGEEIVTLE